MSEAAEAEFVDEFETAVKVVYRAAALDVAARAAAAAEEGSELGASFTFIDKNVLRYAVERGAELVTKINETTRDTIRDFLEVAMAEGWSNDEYARALRESGVFGDARAMLVARTETALAANNGTLDTLKELGATSVHVHDGDCDECQKVDGQIWPIERALDEPIGHPNCVRSFTAAGFDFGEL